MWRSNSGKNEKGPQKEITQKEKNRINKILSSIKNTNQIEKYSNRYSETLRNIDGVDKAYIYCEKILNILKVRSTEDTEEERGNWGKQREGPRCHLYLAMPLS